MHCRTFSFLLVNSPVAVAQTGAAHETGVQVTGRRHFSEIMDLHRFESCM
jgi:hypothetical protein